MTNLNRKTLTKVLLMVLFFSWTGCKSRNTAATADIKGSSIDDASAETEGPKIAELGKIWLFLGTCAPSRSECRSSCVNRDGASMLNEDLCPAHLGKTFFACACPYETAPVAEPPSESTHWFAGCVPTASECRSSCQSGTFTAQQNSLRCPGDPYEFACYCGY